MLKNKKQIAKNILGVVVQYGTGIIVYGIIQKNVTAVRLDHKIGVAAAAFALGGLMGEAAQKYSDQTVEEFFGLFNNDKDNS